MRCRRESESRIVAWSSSHAVEENTDAKTNALFEETLAWLKQNYSCFRFFVERDLVWTVQMHLLDSIQERGLPYKVFNDYPMLPSKHRARSSDLAILNSGDEVEVAAEFKYEPSHKRNDIPTTKFPVVYWGTDGVQKDIHRIQEFVDNKKAVVAYALFFDEGGSFSKRPPHPNSKWIEWGNGLWLLYTRT
jgi:hypothetical protein